MRLNKDEINFFEAEGFFRLKKLENQRKRFDDIWLEYTHNYALLPCDKEVFFQALLEEQEKRKSAKKQKQLRKLAETNSRPVCAGAKSIDEHITKLPAGRYLVTSAQNNTFINKDFLKALDTYCETNNCQLIVGRLTYNKNGFTQEQDEVWYDPEIRPYLLSGHISLDNYAHVLMDANVIPTAKNPLTGFSGATDPGIHVIVPHTKISLRIGAALKNSPTKILASTGSVTLPNYIMKRAGATASLEHCHGAVFVDTVERKIRHLEMMPGAVGFHDVDKIFYAEGAICIEDCVEALQLGDVHAEKLDSSDVDSCVSLIRELRPRNLLLHDVSDFSARNHHNIRCPIFMHEQHLAGNTVKSGLKKVAKTIDKLGNSSDNMQIHIVESNHDTAIMTWLSKENVIKDDPANAVTYLQCMLALYKHQEKHPNQVFNMLKYAYKVIGCGKLKEDKLIFHETDTSFVLAGVENCHGNFGINGSRGSPAQFRNQLGMALNTGHTHTPSIYGKVYTSGVCRKELGYNKGAGSWALAHIVTYVNGQRQIIFME